jgi:hypothetical protein
MQITCHAFMAERWRQAHLKRTVLVVTGWDAHVAREVARYEDGEARLPGLTEADDRQRQLTRMGNAAGGAGLALLMDGRGDDAATWFAHAAERYRESFADAPPASWGRPIGAMKARVLASDWDGARADAEWALDVHARDAESPIGRYAACLALLVLDQDDEAVVQAASIQGRDDFPADVADALASLALRDVDGYGEAVCAVLGSFETREGYLEDIPVADTVIVLQALADRRAMAVELSSPLLPA